MRPNNRELSQEDWPDLLVGGAKLFRLIPSKSMKDFQAPAACLYNKTSKDYVLAVGKALVVYEATTGFYARRIPVQRQISAAAFDVPRERRVVLGTENGEVLVVNYISGEVISKIRAHQGEIVGVAHGGDKARCVISAGRDNCLKVHQETSKGLELLRTVENAQSWVGSLAYSPVLSLIATGSRSGRVALWDFCTLQQMQNLQCRGAVASVLFLDPRPLLLTGDAHGSIIMWLVRPKKQVSTLCIIEGAGSGITSLTRFDSTHHIAAGTDDGLIVMWDALTIESIAPISLLERPDRDATYKPYRKAHRDQGRCDYAKIIECDTSDAIEPLASVKAHDDAVLYVLGVDRPQCIYSTSSDGVQRLWRLDELHIQTESEIDSFAGPAPAPIEPETILACCGCFDLPNKPADTFTSFTEVEWDYFDREKAAATAKDRERAKTMLTMVQRKRDMKQVFRRAVKKVMLVLAFGGRVELANEFRDDEGVQKEWARRLDQRSIGQRDASMRRSRMRTDRACEGTGPAAREGLRNKVIAQMGSPTPPPKIISGPQRRVNDFMERIGRIPEARPAFSEPSIRNGIKEGLYHGEEERYLTQLREYPEKLEAYARRVNGGHANMPLGSDTVIDEEPLVKIENGFPVINKGVKHMALDDVSRQPSLVGRVQEKMDDETTLTSGKKAVKTRMEHHRRRSLKRRPSTVNITELVRPNYTEKDVQAFQDAFEFVDVDFSGMIDMEEWFLFLRRMEQRLNPVEAQLLFLHLDSDRDGLLTMLELLQIVFSKLERRDQVALHKVCWDAHLHLAARRKQKDMELLIQKRTERLLGRGGDDSSVGSRSVGSFTLSTVTGVL